MRGARWFAVALTVSWTIAGCPAGGDDDDSSGGGADADGDGFDAVDDCDDADGSVFPGADDPCDGVDNDCDGVDGADADGDGYPTCGDEPDCDDADAAVHPGADEEQDNALDDDCDGVVDEIDLPCETPETEPNDHLNEPHALASDDDTCGYIDPPGDQDWFEVQGQPWTMIRFTLRGPSLGSSLVPTFELLADQGLTVRAAGTGTEDVELRLLTPDAQTYHAVLTDLAGGGGLAHVYSLTTRSSDPCDAIEHESNDVPADAEGVVLGFSFCGQIDGDSDFDWYAVDLTTGDTIDASLRANEVGSTLNAQLSLYAPDGSTQLLIDEPYWPDDPSLSWTAEQTGTHYLLVESDLYGLNDQGVYALEVD